jgi:UDP-perosamine 4-acetyltransferase
VGKITLRRAIARSEGAEVPAGNAIGEWVHTGSDGIAGNNALGVPWSLAHQHRRLHPLTNTPRDHAECGLGGRSSGAKPLLVGSIPRELGATPLTYLIVGASDQALVLVDILDRLGQLDRVLAVLDASVEGKYVGRRLPGLTVSGTIEDLARPDFADCLVIPAIGDRDRRRDIVRAAQENEMELAVIIDRAAIVSPRASVAGGSCVGPGAVLGPRSSVGTGSIVNTGAIIEHHVQVGAFCHIGPGARIAGNCTVEDGATIAVGASVRDEVTIGAGAVVGAGAAVVGDVEAGSTVGGVPAKPLGG